MLISADMVFTGGQCQVYTMDLEHEALYIPKHHGFFLVPKGHGGISALSSGMAPLRLVEVGITQRTSMVVYRTPTLKSHSCRFHQIIAKEMVNKIGDRNVGTIPENSKVRGSFHLYEQNK